MIKIRKLKLSDAKEYVTLHNLVWQSAYAHIFPKEVFIDREKRSKEKIENFHNLVNAPNEIGYVAEIDTMKMKTNESSCIPIKLYLQKQTADQI